MSTPTNSKQLSSVRIDVDILSALPFPALIFNPGDSIVLKSNEFFSGEANIPVINLLNQFNYSFFTDNDLVILQHRLRKEEKIHTQRLIQRDPVIKSFEIYLSLIGQTGYVLLVFTESKKQAENNQAAFLKDILQGVSEGIGCVNADSTITFCNRSFASLFGKEDKQLIGENLLCIIDKQNLAVLEMEIESQKALMESTFELETKTFDGKFRHILVHAIPKADRAGKYAGSLFTTIDISERVVMERELVFNKNKAQESDRLKSTFLANMSHEIRTPMNSIIGFSAMLLRGGLDQEKQDQYLKIIISRGKHLMQILDDIIDITKIEEDQILLNIKSFNLHDLFAELKTYVESELVQQKKEYLQVNVSHGLKRGEASISADYLRLQQVLANLLNNAVKFTNTGFIEFGYFKGDADQMVFFVKDTGIGIQPSMHQLIFERFRQVDESFSRSYGGTGLGLAICKGLLQLMGGKIWVESDGLQGSTFYFSLPENSCEVHDSVYKPSASDVSFNWKGRTIMIVEDDPSSYDFLYEVLSEYSCEIYHVSNGKDALLAFSQNPSDLILLDIQLPEVDGYEIARQIRQLNPTIPIIAQTAHAMSDDRQKCLDSGCNEYVTKPIQVDALLQTIDYYLSR